MVWSIEETRCRVRYGFFTSPRLQNISLAENSATMVSQAKSLLTQNWRNGYTIPSGRLYPFQWNWDSGFIALGLSYYDMASAIAEIEHLCLGQWENGMIPHIIFHHPNNNYYPGPSVWQVKMLTQNAPDVETSGITQPAVLGFVLNRMHKYASEKPANWEIIVKTLFHKIVAFHRYLYEQRDPQNEGLVFIRHNWESGTDNSPVWDDILNSIDINITTDVSSLRKDNKNVDEAERPTNDNYRRYLYLVELFKQHHYNDKEIVHDCPFLVQDVLFNCMLVKSNFGLIELADAFGLDGSEIKDWNKKTINAINTKLWDDETGCYYAYDMVAKRSIKIKTSSAFMPLFAGIASHDQAAKMAHHLTNTYVKNSEWLMCPSVASNEPSFNPVKYWRGPVWINVNWMLYHGLVRYGYHELAERVLHNTVKLIEEMGLYEYYDPRPLAEGGVNKGIGADNFSWTAALYLDIIYNKENF